jgi:hypothetical protein
MSIIGTWFRRPEPASGGRAVAEDLVDHWLTPDLLTTLGSLHEAPPAVATAAVQLLPFGSRAALEELGLARPGDTGTGPVVLTPLAYEVMAVAAERAQTEPDDADEWTRAARRAAFPDRARRRRQ